MTGAPGDDELAGIVALELRLHDPVFRRSPTAAALLDPGFREFGASGRVWDLPSTRELLAGSDTPPPEVDQVTTVRLAADLVQVTYRARRPERTALRSSLWRRSATGAWRMLFHQGTVVPAGHER